MTNQFLILTISTLLLLLIIGSITKLKWYYKIPSNKNVQLYSPIYKEYKNEVFPKNIDIIVQVIFSCYSLSTNKNINKDKMFQFIIFACINHLTVLLLKRVFLLPRPFTMDVYKNKISNVGKPYMKIIDIDKNQEKLHYYFRSFPSGHSANATYFLLNTLQFSNNNIIKILSIITTYFITISRIYYNRHHQEDVLCGCLIGGFNYYLKENIF